MQSLLSKIPAVRPGEDIRAEDWNALREALIALANGENITEGVGVRKRQTGGGIILNADPKRQAGGDGTIIATETLPFKVTKVAGGADEDDSVKVLAGYLGPFIQAEATYVVSSDGYIGEGLDDTDGNQLAYVVLEGTLSGLSVITAAAVTVLTVPEIYDFDLANANLPVGGVFRIPLAKITLSLHPVGEGEEATFVTRISAIEQLWRGGNIWNLIASTLRVYYW
jgi:hypothetical protein